jgi:cob(I)alamin adenosyltransferase
MKIYTRKGDTGTTGLFYGGRVPKTAPAIEANGAVDEAQAAIGVARAEAPRGSELDALLTWLARDLWVLMAEIGTAVDNRAKLQPDASLVTEAMVVRLEAAIDDLTGRFPEVTEFVVPGQDRVAAALDVARTVTRRAERLALAVDLPGDSHVIAYLNRLSDLLWTMARWQESEAGGSLPTRSVEPRE